MASARVTICLPVFNDRRQGLVISADNVCSHAKNLASHFIMAMWTSATCNYAADLPRHYSGVVAKFNRKDWAVERGLQDLPLRAATYDRLNIACLILAGFLVWRFLKKGRPAMLRMMNGPAAVGHH